MSTQSNELIVALVGAIIAALGLICKSLLKQLLCRLRRVLRQRNRCSPMKSRLFNDLQSILDDKIPVLPINCPKRRLMCQTILQKMFECILQETKKLATEQVNTLSNVELACCCDAFLNRLFHKWRTQVQATDVPRVVVATFVLLSSDYEEIIRTLTRDIALNDLIQDNNEKLRLILDTISSVYSVTLVNAQRTITNLNGELDNVTYRGLTCSTCESICDHKRSNSE